MKKDSLIETNGELDANLICVPHHGGREIVSFPDEYYDVTSMEAVYFQGGSTRRLSEPFVEQRPTEPKDLYREILKSAKKGVVQRTWGRIQEEGEEDYIRFLHAYIRRRILHAVTHALPVTVNQVADFLTSAPQQAINRLEHALSQRDVPTNRLIAIQGLIQNVAGKTRSILERFDGFVDQIDNHTAYVTLKCQNGETLYGQYSAEELAKRGISEGRRFTCVTVEIGGEVRVELEAIPDKEISVERTREIQENIERALGSDGSNDDF